MLRYQYPHARKVLARSRHIVVTWHVARGVGDCAVCCITWLHRNRQYPHARKVLARSRHIVVTWHVARGVGDCAVCCITWLHRNRRMNGSDSIITEAAARTGRVAVYSWQDPIQGGAQSHLLTRMMAVILLPQLVPKTPSTTYPS